jgi:hypothetical protein
VIETSRPLPDPKRVRETLFLRSQVHRNHLRERVKLCWNVMLQQGTSLRQEGENRRR